MHYLQQFYKNNKTHYVLVYWHNKPTCDVSRTLEKLANHKYEESGLQTFVF